MRRVPLATVIALALALVVASVSGQKGDDALDERARRVHRDAIVIDTHIDTTSHLRSGWRFADRHRPVTEDATGGNSVDLPRMRDGGVDGAFFAVYVSGLVTGHQAVKAARADLDTLRILAEMYPEDLSLCRTAAEVRASHAAGRVCLLIGIEGGHMINEDLETLRDYARLGARYLTLTHTVHVPWAGSSGAPPRTAGLTDFGRQVVRELNRLGMLVDVSHVSDKTFWDVIETSEAPIIATHSSCRQLCDQARNLTDEMIKAIAARGGTVQINFHAPFLDHDLAREIERRRPMLEAMRADLERRLPGPEHAREREAEARIAEAKMGPLPRVSWERIVDHIDHVVQLVGADHVGIGSDFDGATMPDGMSGCNDLPKVTRELLRRGYKEAAIRKILGGNVLRVMEDAEKVSRRLRASEALSAQ